MQQYRSVGGAWNKSNASPAEPVSHLKNESLSNKGLKT